MAATPAKRLREIFATVMSDLLLRSHEDYDGKWPGTQRSVISARERSPFRLSWRGPVERIRRDFSGWRTRKKTRKKKQQKNDGTTKTLRATTDGPLLLLPYGGDGHYQ